MTTSVTRFLKERRPQTVGVLLVVIFSLAVFGYHSSQLGIYSDDAGFLESVHSDMTLGRLFQTALDYVPGRNLHIIWQYLITVFAGGSVIESLPRMHFFQVFVDTVNNILFLWLLRLWGVRLGAALVGALFFCSFPNHGETHFWLSALPMNLMSTSFVLLLLCSATVFVVRVNNQRQARWLYVVLTISGLAAMFTYDQAVPVVVATITILWLFLVIQRRKYSVPVSVIWLIYCVAFASIIIWKTTSSMQGPTFSDVSVSHIYSIFQESLRVWISTWDPTTLLPLWDLTSGGEKILSFVLVGIVTAVLALPAVANLFRLSRTSPVDLAAFAPKRNILIFGAGLTFMLFSYVPTYLWYLSPRHNYLPSVGMAIMLSGLVSMIWSVPTRGNNTRTMLGFTTRLLTWLTLAGFLTLFIGVNITEKGFWIRSYSMRSGMYNDVAGRRASTRQTVVMLAGFPPVLEPATPHVGFSVGFFGQEQPFAIQFLTRGRLAATHLALHPIPAQRGFLIYTEAHRWVDEAIRYVNRADATLILFDKIANNRLYYSYDASNQLLSPEKFYSLSDGVEPGLPATEGDQLKVWARGSGYGVHIPDVSVKSEEILALVPWAQAAQSHARVGTALSPEDGEEIIIPIDVTEPARHSGYAHFKYNIAMPRIDGFRLYAINESGSRLISEVFLEHELK